MKQGQPTKLESEFLKKRDEMILRNFAEITSHAIASLACTYGLSPRRIQEICVTGGLLLREELTNGSSHHQSSKSPLVSHPLTDSQKYDEWPHLYPFQWWQHPLSTIFVLPFIGVSSALVVWVVLCVRAHRLLFV